MFKLDASASIRALENGKQDFFKDQAPWLAAVLVAGLLLMLAAARYSRILMALRRRLPGGQYPLQFRPSFVVIPF